MAAERQLIAIFLVAVCRVFVETEFHGFEIVGVFEVKPVAGGLDSEKHIFVKQMILFVRQILLDERAQLLSGTNVRLHLSKRKSTIAHLIAGDLRIGFAGDVAIAFLDF